MSESVPDFTTHMYICVSSSAIAFKVGITTSAGKKIESIWLENQSQTFEFDVAEQPLMVRFDEGDILLKEWSLDKPVSELLYQLEHDNVIGRL